MTDFLNKKDVQKIFEEEDKEQSESKEGKVFSVDDMEAFGKFLLDTTVKATDGKYYVYKGENFWTLKNILHLFINKI